MRGRGALHSWRCREEATNGPGSCSQPRSVLWRAAVTPAMAEPRPAAAPAAARVVALAAPARQPEARVAAATSASCLRTPVPATPRCAAGGSTRRRASASRSSTEAVRGTRTTSRPRWPASALARLRSRTPARSSRVRPAQCAPSPRRTAPPAPRLAVRARPAPPVRLAVAARAAPAARTASRSARGTDPALDYTQRLGGASSECRTGT